MNPWLGLFVILTAFIDGFLVGIAVTLPRRRQSQ
jgi:hypothetical protein